MVDRIEFLIGEGFLALRRNGWMTFAAITTVSVALFLIGGLAYLYGQLKSEATELTGLFEIRASLAEGTRPDQISAIAKEIREIPSVKSAVWIPRDKAWKRFLDEHPEHRQYAELENPYPDMFKITLSDLKSSEDVVAQIKAIQGVRSDEVKYLSDVAGLFADLQAIVGWLGFVLGGILFLTGGILIYNAIRLTVISRRLEIRIMQLVGASFLTVRIPFYIEGFVQGALGGGLSVFLLFASYKIFEWRLPDFFSGSFAGQSKFRLPDFPALQFLLLLPALGAVYGLLCSTVAVRTPLRYR